MTNAERRVEAINKVSALLASYGSTWDPADYKSAHAFFPIRCHCGTEAKARWTDIRDGRTRPLCREHIKATMCDQPTARSRRKTSLSRLMEKARSQGAFIQVSSYRGTAHPVTFFCGCGRKVEAPSARNKYRDNDNFYCYPCLGNVEGQHHHHYNPRLTDEDRQNRRLLPWYRDWEIAVLERYDYECVITGAKGTLACHHLYNWAAYPEHRQEVSNGVPLTRELHKMFHKSYGKRNNTPAQFAEFFRIQTKGREFHAR